jgi:glutathione synthase/RimK-type ligase-like ATP-grasp enzyme
MSIKIGLMVGREWSLPPALIEEIRSRRPTWAVEYLKLATPRVEDEIEYTVIVDRISHAVPFYRTYLKTAALRGVAVINDPFLEAVDDRFTAATVARRLGVRLPRMAVLPHREYAEGIVHEESLRNLDYPLDWQGVLDYVGAPCVLKEATGSGEPSYVCHSVEELLQHYNGTGQRLMIAQEQVRGEALVRAFVIGGDEVLLVRLDPDSGRTIGREADLPGELRGRLTDDSRRIAKALGYQVNSIDWAIREGEATAVDLLNPVPEIDIYALTQEPFEWVVSRLADLVVAAGEGASAPPARGGGRAPEELPSLARDLPHSEIQPRS